MLHEQITDKIIHAFYTVNNNLGYGFLERVYENAMMIELKQLDCKVIKQKNIKVFYKGEEIGEYFADLIVDDCVIVELKAIEKISKEHEAQLINYLKSTRIEVGLLLNLVKSQSSKEKSSQTTKNEHMPHNHAKNKLEKKSAYIRVFRVIRVQFNPGLNVAMPRGHQ
jgi:GxxExxY protein